MKLIVSFLIGSILLAQVPRPITWQPAGGAIGGASSVANTQVLYGTGAGVAGSKNTFVFDAVNDRLGVGTASPSERLTIAQSGSVAANLRISNNDGALLVGLDAGGSSVIRTTSNARFLSFGIDTERARFAAITGNLLLNTTTDDGTNRLQVAGTVRFNTTDSGFPAILRFVNSSATAGDWRFQVPGTTTGARDGGLEFANASGWPHLTLSQAGTLTLHSQIPALGSTSLIVRAGAGQASNNLQTWQNSGGSELARVNSSGDFTSGGFILSGSIYGGLYQSGLRFSSTPLITWAASTNALASIDASISRQGPNTIQFGDGGANPNATILAGSFNVSGTGIAARYRATLTTPASASAAGTQGDILWDANFVYVCTATNTWKRAAIATW
jgi:hypothetical protein